MTLAPVVDADLMHAIVRYGRALRNKHGVHWICSLYSDIGGTHGLAVCQNGEDDPYVVDVGVHENASDADAAARAAAEAVTPEDIEAFNYNRLAAYISATIRQVEGWTPENVASLGEQIRYFKDVRWEETP